MKDPRFIISAFLIVGLAAFGFVERQKIADLERQIAQLRADASAQTATALEQAATFQKRIEDGKQVIAQLETRRKEAPAGELAAGEAANTNSGEKKEGKKDFGEMMKKMFTDPNMKKVVRNTQMVQVKLMYADLAKALGLNAEQANQIMEILGDRQMAMTTKGMKMFGAGGEAEGGKQGEVGQEIEAANKEYDAQLESILGQDGMTKLSDYEKTLGDRMQIEQYKQAFTASGLPLNDAEAGGLLGIMQEERLKQPASPLAPGTKDFGAAVNAMKSDETFSRLMSEQRDLDARVLSRAPSVLGPDKMGQFEGFQKNIREIQTMSIEMGRQFVK